jgi:hypothetical protein
MADRMVTDEEDDRTPDWGVWRWICEFQLWQLVALSLNIDPHKVKTNDDSWYGTPLIFDESQEFHDRLYVLCASAARGMLANPRSYMSFRTFAGLLHRFAWVPPEMLAMAEEHDPRKQETPTSPEGNAHVEPRTHNKRDTEARHRSWQAQIDNLAKKHPGTSHAELCRKVAPNTGVTWQTIRRYTERPHS